MKGMTDSDLVEVLDAEFAWRRKELTSVLTDVKTAHDDCRSPRLRAATALLYAHWEGFVKASSEVYLEFVAQRRLRHSDLNDGLLALALRSRLNSFQSNNDVSSHLEFIRFFQNELTSRAVIPDLAGTRPGANLTSKRLKAIILSLGLDYSPFELKENLIDSQLVGWRNTIAHGKGLCPKEEEFYSLYEQIVLLLRNFKDQISNAVILRAYRKSA
jgi:hypothetical protein